MDYLRDTPLEAGFLFWPFDPPESSMVVVVKATFALADGHATLAETQDPATGPLFWEDDPERSPRFPNEYALLKPRGECFVTGSVRTLTGPVERTVARFEVGAVRKSLVVHGDRVWGGRPAPFDAMPLAWERAYGGARTHDNPVGRDGTGEFMPNLELEGQPVTDRNQRGVPACTTPIGIDWPSRRALAGTCDATWQQTRWPWLPADFRYAFFNEAPADQQIEGYWRGDETVRLTHLHPAQPRIECTLPGLIARAFVVRGSDADDRASFEEVGLVLDTLTVDADRGVLHAVFRGRVPLGHNQLAPDGLARLYVTHDALAERTSLDQMHARMRASAQARDAQLEAMAGEAPPETTADVDKTLQDDTGPEIAMVREAASRMEAQQRAEAAIEQAGDPLTTIRGKLAEAGVDLDAVIEQSEARAEGQGRPDLTKLREAFETFGGEVPEGFETLEAELDKLTADPAAPSAYEAPSRDLRAELIEAHRRGVPLEGDYTRVNAAGLDLRGLDARGAVLMEANFRGSQLGQAKLDGASLVRADFLSADLGRASLRDADLTDAVLEDADLREARLDGACLDGAELDEAKLDGATLLKTSLRAASLRKASLTNARCEGATFTQCQLEQARLSGADLKEAKLYTVQAARAILDGADLRKLRVGRQADLSGVSARNVRADDSNWRDSNLNALSLEGALNDADFSGSDLSHANLSGCVMRRAVFRGATLADANLEGSDVFEGSFQGADVSRANMRRSNLYAANFYEAFGTEAKLDGAILDGTYWEKKR